MINEAGDVLDRQLIHNDQADFNITLPVLDEEFYFYYPLTGDSQRITKNGRIELNLHSDFIGDINFINRQLSSKRGKKSTQGVQGVTGTNLLGNGDFALNSFIYTTTVNAINMADDGQWYNMDNYYTWDTKNGSKVYRAKKKRWSVITQVVSVTPGDSFSVSCDADGVASIILGWYDNTGTYFGFNAYPNYGNSISASQVIPTNAAYVAVTPNVFSHGWVDNVHYSTDPAVTDADGDGVTDSNDAFPSDPSRAYITHFPTAGYQTLAFEDLWPAQGDFDFNDMVVSTKIDYSTHANHNKVDATVTISLDAMGAGASNGLAIRLLDANKQPFSGNIISSISGDATLDQDNANGIIVFNDAKTAQSEHYTNTGNGPNKQPDEFTFTITFNSSVGTQSIVPDIYIYRTGERGKEIHLDGFSGSDAADPTLFNTKDDYNGSYNSPSGLPWVIEVITANKTFKHPLEKTDILVAYPRFQQWAESGGTTAQDWMLSPTLGKVFQIL